ncbi:94d07a8f-0d83-4077-a9aa-b89883a0fc4a [Sclerotinia trifoliorum]|uniref:94d07a8f-0d83-4077-a9aa-b89883a0fc4a n=1 Tax=Sclerotinia trifoliorum TaxID=28548 RepID=A0A8H2ZQK4_9HELO|nr:94d07a8f-0d83-4077-a9aa-b89883a0fc4a [Sclerotinia trifoliorum]
MSAPVVDYDHWFKDQEYGPGCYPNLDALIFLRQADQLLYLQNERFQAETMRVHETVAPTTATAYDITILSRRVPGYWRMILSVAKADRAWNDWYGDINTPHSLLGRWSRSKRILKDLVIKNQRAADLAAAEEENQEENGDNHGGDDEDQSDDEGEENGDEDEEETND